MGGSQMAVVSVLDKHAAPVRAKLDDVDACVRQVPDLYSRRAYDRTVTNQTLQEDRDGIAVTENQCVSVGRRCLHVCGDVVRPPAHQPCAQLANRFYTETACIRFTGRMPFGITFSLPLT